MCVCVFLTLRVTELCSAHTSSAPVPGAPVLWGWQHRDTETRKDSYCPGTVFIRNVSFKGSFLIKLPISRFTLTRRWGSTRTFLHCVPSQNPLYFMLQVEPLFARQLLYFTHPSSMSYIRSHNLSPLSPEHTISPSQDFHRVISHHHSNSL